MQICDWCLSSGFDRGFVDDEQLRIMSPVAQRISVEWARGVVARAADCDALRSWLQSCSADSLREDDIWFVRGAPDDPRHGYFVDRTGDAQTYPHERTEALFAALPSEVTLCIAGCVGWPGIMREDGVVTHASFLPEVVPRTERMIVSLGSVGMPEDRDSRATYGLLSEKGFEFRRVAYDVEAFIADVEAAGLPASLGSRRLEGL